VHHQLLGQDLHLLDDAAFHGARTNYITISLIANEMSVTVASRHLEGLHALLHDVSEAVAVSSCPDRL
jgi:hypothetical protein